MSRWWGSFRLRVFGLITLVGVAGVGMTAWLIVTQANSQLNGSAAAQRRVVPEIIEELTEYGITHGTWEGVPEVVARLRDRTGQRIRLTTEWGEVIVDSDHLDGEAARSMPAQSPALVDPRPRLVLGWLDAAEAIEVVLEEIDRYRSSVRYSICLTSAGEQVRIVDGPYGVPRLVAAHPRSENHLLERCEQVALSTPGELAADAREIQPCRLHLASLPDTPQDDASFTIADELTVEIYSCLNQVFLERIADVTPVPLLLYLGVGVGETSPLRLSLPPVLLASGLIALVAIGSTVLLSRWVLRPIDDLIRASRRVGEGEFSERVPLRGRDELADLVTAFNRMADSLQASERRQRQMIADIAHELRTPLANIRGYLEALKDGVLTPSEELFASLHEEAVLQQRIVNDLQDLTLAEAGTLVHHRVQIDMAEVLETCRRAYAAAAEASGVTLRLVTDEQLPVVGDPDRLRQAIGNLLSNALRATPAGGEVTLRAYRESDPVRPQAWVVVEVADTGVGIASADLPRIFDRFWRADAARGRDTGGSGLGLSIVREIVAAHQGTITARSTVGVGSVFTVRIPAAVEELKELVAAQVSGATGDCEAR